MAKLQTSKARTDIYARGLKTPADNKQKYSLDRSKPADENDRIIVKKGDTYYWWQFKNSPKQISATKPKRQQLTQSSFYITVWDLEDNLEALSASSVDDLQSERDNITEEIETLKDETQGSLDNMPEGLQQGDTGQMLQERVDALENWKDELDSVDLDDYEEPDNEYIIGESEKDVEDIADLEEEEVERIKQEHVQQWVDEKIGELQAITSGV